MVVSFTGTALSHIVLATYIFLSTETKINLDAYQWVPVTSFSAMIFIASCGALPIPYVIVSEILPEKVSFNSNYNINYNCKIILFYFSFFVFLVFVSNRFEALVPHLYCAFHGALHLY